MNRLLRILIVDDHAVVRRGLKEIVAEEFHNALFGEAQNGAELHRLIRNQTWDVVILDINMPGRGGLELLKDLKQIHPGLPVLVLSGHSEDQYAIRVVKAGGAGYIPKETAPDELVTAIKRVLAGGKYVSAAVAQKLLFQLESDRDKKPHETLSDREFQVLRLMASGKTPTEIAAALALNVKTISTFRTRILTKMNMRNSAELTRYALENHLLD
jgi:DNA-binding NarL/FixJ family response regulator